MEIITLITWNGLVYLLYYGLNLSYDFFNYKRKQPKESATYSYKDLLIEAPVNVAIPKSSLQSKTSSTAAKEITKEIKQTSIQSPIVIDGPVDDQGLPMEEFLKTSKSFSHNINF
jgi:hypothetical protein